MVAFGCIVVAAALWNAALINSLNDERPSPVTGHDLIMGSVNNKNNCTLLFGLEGGPRCRVSCNTGTQILVRIEFQPTKDEITADFASYQITTYRWNLMLERFRMYVNRTLDDDFFHFQKDISSESQAIYRCVPRNECVILTIFQEEPIGGLNRSMLLPIHYDIRVGWMV